MGREEKIAQTALADLLGELLHQVTAADADENDTGHGMKPFGSGRDGIFVGATEIAGIADNKLILELPLLAQRIVAAGDGRNGVVVAPVEIIMNVVGRRRRQRPYPPWQG